MKQNFYNNQNYDINNMMKYLTIISFIVQWSFLTMLLNLFTMGLVRFPLFIIFILDALSIFMIKNKTIKRPSFILSKIWDLIDLITMKRNGQNLNNANTNSLVNVHNSITNVIDKISKKIKNTTNNFDNLKKEDKKYEAQRELNKFPDSIGKKVIIEYISPGQKLKRKTFEYKDSAVTFIRTLESNSYKNYSIYSINTQLAPAYMIFNQNRDIVDLEKMKIKITSKDKNYKFVTDGWPKK